ncbi:hypothetical protein B0A48_10482 [Cryoendolithus antarcticus]|uniref:DUF985 domain-containing protein n=1 Tax=Cryoendolithus antarcticus TaxID=1507870 RepID=A0A1V8SXT2_9PEZI|nr:hypothetical protein B0A48_10482 [Cryoendolithus antarcticus]
MASAIKLKPFFTPSSPPPPESPYIQSIISHLSLQPHPEGGYFVETDRDTLRVPNSFHPSDPQSTRSASTSIHYLLTPSSPLGHFHRNRGRTVHTLHKGRGLYVLVHADEVAVKGCAGGYGGDGMGEKERWTGKTRVEVFVVGMDLLKGERYVDGGTSSDGLLISETVVPGFEYEDHDFMTKERLQALVTVEQAKEMEWMLRKDS